MSTQSGAASRKNPTYDALVEGPGWSAAGSMLARRWRWRVIGLLLVLLRWFVVHWWLVTRLLAMLWARGLLSSWISSIRSLRALICGLLRSSTEELVDLEEDIDETHAAAVMAGFNLR